MMSLDREPFFSLRSLAAILLGFLFWIFAINALSIVGSEDPLWLDELHTLWSISGADSDIWFRSLEWNQTPAYFYLMHHWSSLFGTDPLVLRLVSIIAFLICAAVMFRKIRSSTGSWCAAISAGVGLALCEPSMFYASEARPYALLMLATLFRQSIWKR